MTGKTVMRAFIVVVMSVALLAGSVLPASAEGGCGDVNQDQIVNSIDALVVLQLVAGVHDPGPIKKFDVWDVNGDEQITSVDALLILQSGAGLHPLECLLI